MDEYEDLLDLEPLPTEGKAFNDMPKSALVARANELLAHLKAGGTISTSALELEIKTLREEQRALNERLATVTSTDAGGSDKDFKRFVINGKGVALQGRQINVGASGEAPCEIWQPGLLDEQKAINPWHADLQQAVEARSWCRIMIKGDDGRGSAPTPKCDAQIGRLLDQAPTVLKGDIEGIKKRIFGGASGSGSDWQQTTVLPMLGQTLRQDPSVVEQLFEVIDIPTKSVVLPFASTMPKPYRYGIPTTENPADFTSSTPETTSRTWTADGQACVIQVFDDASEDSILATLPLLQGMAAMGLRLGFADCIINGDTGTHEDTALSTWNPRSMFDSNAVFGSSLDHRRSFIGLRAMAFDASATRDASGDTTSFTTQTLKAALTALKAPHGVSGSLVYLASPEHYISNILIDPNVLTVDKFGPNATIQAGQVAKILNASIICHELLTADLQATGLYTAAGTKTGGLCFNKDRFKIVQRKGLSVELERRAVNGVTYIVVVQRKTFRTVDGATDKVVHFSYNL